MKKQRKKLKKVTAFLLTIALTMSMCMTSFAENGVPDQALPAVSQVQDEDSGTKDPSAVETEKGEKAKEQPVSSCTGDENCTVDEHESGCPKAEAEEKAVCMKDENCAVDEHESGCPKEEVEEKAVCTKDENCAADEHESGCPKAEAEEKAVCMKDENCTAEEHEEGCPKNVTEEETEPSELQKQIDALLDVDKLESMSDEEKEALYAQLQEIIEELEVLDNTDDLDLTRLQALVDAFSSGEELAADNEAIVTNGNESIGYVSLDEAFVNAADGATITMQKDVQLAGTITISGKSLILDLNGKTITAKKTRPDRQTRAFIVDTGASLEVTDSSMSENKGCITYDGDIAQQSMIEVSGTFILKNGILSGGPKTALWVKDGGSAEIHGGTVTAYGLSTIGVSGQLTINDGVIGGLSKKALSISGKDAAGIVKGGTIESLYNDSVNVYAVEVSNNASFRLEGGRIYSNNVNANAGAVTILPCGAGNVMIAGGSVEAKSVGIKAYASSTNQIAVESGTVTAQTVFGFEPDVTANVSGGTFSSISEAELRNYLKEGCSVQKLSEGKYQVVGGQAEDGVAEVNGIKSPTLAEAFTAAADGETVKVMDEVQDELQIAVSIVISGKAVTLDLNGNTVVSPQKGSLMAFTIREGGKLTVDDTSDGHYGTITAPWSNKSAQVIRAEGEFVLKNGILDTRDMKAVNVSGNGKVTIKGGIVRSNSAAAIDVYNEGSITVEGGLVETTSTVGNAIRLKDNAVGIVKGGTVQGPEGTKAYATIDISSSRGSARLEMEGGAILSRSTKDTTSAISVGSSKAECPLKMTGGRIEAVQTAISAYRNVPVVIEGGEIKSEAYAFDTYSLKITGENVKVTAGKAVFHTDVNMEGFDNQISAGTFTAGAFVEKEEGTGEHFKAALTGGTYTGGIDCRIFLYRYGRSSGCNLGLPGCADTDGI